MEEFLYFVKKFSYYTWISRGVIIALLLLIIIFGLLFSYLQHISIINGIYFIFITALSIGYGDITPITVGCKIISVFAGFIGMIFIGLIIAIATLSLKSAIIDLNKKHRQEK